ncbi:MAG: ABC transporter substrate-binding protein [Sphingomonas sp.]
MIRALLVSALALSVGACEDSRQEGKPIVVSVIGDPARIGDPDTAPLGPPDRALMAATAQGLVRFDGAGQIEPGLAERWTVTDDGLSYIFRLRDASWSDGSPVTAAEVVRVLRKAAQAKGGNSLSPFLAVIDEIVEMTPQVIEVRLRRPRPDLLKLFAQPELAVFRTAGRSRLGSGPMVAQRRGDALLLTPARDPAAAVEEEGPRPPAATPVLLRGERAARAVARFRNGDVDAVLGGTYAEWPLVWAAGIPAERLRLDPALGLFGLAVVSRDGFLAEAANRNAIAMALDRDALTRAFHPDWKPVETLMPQKLDSARAPASPIWGPIPGIGRLITAQQVVIAWKRAHPGKLRLRIAFPPGQGSTLAWAAIAQSMLNIGIVPQRVALGEPADLELIDQVAAYDSGRWFLVTACRLCSPEAMAAIDAARDAVDLSSRSQRIAEADLVLTNDASYIPIAQPFRWSIVTPRVTGWQGNTRAWHPLNHLRNEVE